MIVTPDMVKERIEQLDNISLTYLYIIIEQMKAGKLDAKKEKAKIENMDSITFLEHMNKIISDAENYEK